MPTVVTTGSAEVRDMNGKVKAIRLVATAASHAVRIGEPSDGRACGVRFTRHIRSDDHALIWWEHHPRATYD